MKDFRRLGIVLLTSLFTLLGPVSTQAQLMIEPSIEHVTCLNNDNGEIHVMVSGGQAPYTYSWSTGDNDSAIVRQSPGTYTITVTDSNNVSVIDTFVITENRVHIAPDIGVIDGDSIIETFVSHDYSIGYFQGWEYEWEVEGGFIWNTNTNEVSVAWSFSPENWIAVDVYDSIGCNNQDTLFARITVGIADDPATSIQVYPNPAKGLLNIKRSSNALANITLIDVSGRVILQDQINSELEQIELMDLSNGAYILRIQQGENVTSFPLMIRH